MWQGQSGMNALTLTQNKSQYVFYDNFKL